MKHWMLLLCLLAPLGLNSQPVFPEVRKPKRLAPTAGSKTGALVLYSAMDAVRDAKPARTGVWLMWDYDPALLPFTEFRVMGRKDVTKPETLLATVTTNRWALMFSNGPMMVVRIDAVDVALPKTSLGKVK